MSVEPRWMIGGSKGERDPRRPFLRQLAAEWHLQRAIDVLGDAVARGVDDPSVEQMAPPVKWRSQLFGRGPQPTELAIPGRVYVRTKSPRRY